MTYQAVQTRRFARQYKKLHDNIAADVDVAVDAAVNSPKIGDKKKVTYRPCMFTNFEVRDNFIYSDTPLAKSSS